MELLMIRRHPSLPPKIRRPFSCRHVRTNFPCQSHAAMASKSCYSPLGSWQLIEPALGPQQPSGMDFLGFGCARRSDFLAASVHYKCTRDAPNRCHPQVLRLGCRLHFSLPPPWSPVCARLWATLELWIGFWNTFLGAWVVYN